MSGWIPLVRVGELWGLPQTGRVLWRLRVLRVNLPEETLAVLREASPYFTLAA